MKIVSLLLIWLSAVCLGIGIGNFIWDGGKLVSVFCMGAVVFSLLSKYIKPAK
jgi:hypothetical protein